MPLSDALNRTATINSVTFDANGQETKTPILTNVPTRVEQTQRFIQDALGHSIVTNFLFIFDIADVSEGSVQAEYIIDFSGLEYKIVKAILLDDLTSPHHWEVFTV